MLLQLQVFAVVPLTTHLDKHLTYPLNQHELIGFWQSLLPQT